MLSTPDRPRDPWIRPLRRNGSARVRLFCLPYAGGGTAPFRPWALALPGHVETHAVCLPGREDRWLEPAFDRMRPLVRALADAIRPWLDRTFVLYGHSMGALVAFELARELRASGGPEPARLIVSGRGAPDMPVPSPLSQLPDDRFVEALNARYNGLPRQVLDEPELLALYLPLLRADLSTLETYELRPAAPLACPISAFSGLQDPNVSAEGLARWHTHTAGAFAQRRIAGDHFFIHGNQAEFLPLLSGELRQVS